MSMQNWRRGGKRPRAAGTALRLGRAAACAAWLTCTLGLSSVAQGQEPASAAPAGAAQPTARVGSEPSAAQRETARAWVLEGRRLFDAGDYAAALERCSAAYQLVRVPTVGIEVARAQEALGKWVEANATAVEVINLPRSEAEPVVFEQARDAARQLLRSLMPRIPGLQIELTPAIAEARVHIDGEAMLFTRGAMPFKLNPGAHELRVQAPGYRSELRTVVLLEREVQVLSVMLVPEHSPEPLAQSGAGLRAPAPAADQTTPTGARTRGHVALGVAGAAALLGSVTGVLAFSSKPDCPGNICSGDRRDEARRSRTFGIAADVSFGAALVAAAYGGWELLFNAPAESGSSATRPALRAGLVAHERGAALQVLGAF